MSDYRLQECLVSVLHNFILSSRVLMKMSELLYGYVLGVFLALLEVSMAVGNIENF